MTKANGYPYLYKRKEMTRLKRNADSTQQLPPKQPDVNLGNQRWWRHRKADTSKDEESLGFYDWWKQALSKVVDTTPLRVIRLPFEHKNLHMTMKTVKKSKGSHHKAGSKNSIRREGSSQFSVWPWIWVGGISGYAEFQQKTSILSVPMARGCY